MKKTLTRKKTTKPKTIPKTKKTSHKKNKQNQKQLQKTRTNSTQKKVYKKQTKTKKTPKKTIQKTIPKKETKTTPTKNNKNWFTKETILSLLAIFLAIELLGLVIATNLYVQGNTSPLFTENINDILNGLHLFVMIIITTIIFLVITKFRKTKKFILGIEMLAVTTTSLIVFLALTNDNYIFSLLLTTILFVMRYSRIKNKPIRSITAGIAVAGAGAYMGASIGLIPIILFVAILALYDIFAVFYSKHMVEIGKASTQNNYAFTINIPTKNHSFEIGNGDFAIPLIIASSTLINGPFTNNLFLVGLILGASYLGLILSLLFVSKYKKPMPALPPQVLLMLLTILFGYLFFI